MPRMMRLMPAASVFRAGTASEPEGASRMPLMDCPNCDGTGYTQDASGEEIVCPMCDGTGVLVDEEGDADVE
jgi:DnaJ-class molecular chaperone